MYDLSLLSSYGNDIIISKNVEIKRPELINIGDHVAIDSYFYITTGAVIGSYVHISAHVGVIGGARSNLIMGNFCNISLGGRIICCSDEFKGHGLITSPGIPDEFLDNKLGNSIVFEDFVNLGANVVILPGVKLAVGTVIGANSLVNKDTEPWTIYYGSPAKAIKKRDNCNMLLYADKLINKQDKI